MWRRVSNLTEHIEFAIANSVSDAIARLAELTTPHVLLLAMDATHVNGEDLGTLADAIVESHCFWMAAWGPGCSHVDDAVDMDIVMREINGRPHSRLVMTTWHDKETLRSALWTACHTAMPSEEWKLETWTRRVLVIGGVVSEDSLVRDIESMEDELGKTHG